MAKLKEKIEIKKGITLTDVLRYYWPGISDERIDYFLWNETCYPFDTEKTLEQIYQIYTEETKNQDKA